MEINKTPTIEKALEIMEQSNQSIFLTGKAGTGKSTLLQYFIKTTKKSVAVLAPTGVAALNVGGQTIHSFFRFGPNITLDNARKLGRAKADSTLLRAIDTIIIDEISMVRADLLDCIDMFLRAAIGETSAFGGKQMIFIGDLYQLPPVVKYTEKEYFKTHYESPYFFSAHVISDKRVDLTFVELDTIFRQSDETFINILNGVRNRSVTDQDLAVLNQRVEVIDEDLASDYITLTTTNKKASEINAYSLKKLESSKEIDIYDAVISDKFKSSQYPADQELHICPGARVMCLNNDSHGQWVNGTMGTVRDIWEHEGSAVVSIMKDNGQEIEIEPHTWEVKEYIYDQKTKTLSQNKIGSFTQLPLRLAWAVTIHKSQGKTFDRVIIDLGRGTFAHGQTYVALSRCTSLEGLILRQPVQQKHILMDYAVVKFLTQFQYDQAAKLLSHDDKIKLLADALKAQTLLSITYLKSNDSKSTRNILVREISTYTYMGKSFEGIKAHCMTEKTQKTFRIDRILEIEL